MKYIAISFAALAALTLSSPASAFSLLNNPPIPQAEIPNVSNMEMNKEDTLDRVGVLIETVQRYDYLLPQEGEINPPKPSLYRTIAANGEVLEAVDVSEEYPPSPAEIAKCKFGGTYLKATGQTICLPSMAMVQAR